MKFYGLRWLYIILLVAVLAGGCAAPVQKLGVEETPAHNAWTATYPVDKIEQTDEKTPVPAAYSAATLTSTLNAIETENAFTPTPDLRLPPEKWREWPVIPSVSAKAVQIYQKGMAQGNNPHTFSKVGDCQSISQVLLGIYDKPDRYILTEAHKSLQETIDQFKGSFDRDGMAVKGGFNAAAVLSPMWADPDSCTAGETPLECEYRVHRPGIAIISLEVWWKGRTVERYEAYMRQIIGFFIEHGVVPILSTKADNLEKDHSINLATARLAYEYDIPLWNFWKAVQTLPNQGIDPARDGFHISTQAWNVRSQTALQSLDAVWRVGEGQSGNIQTAQTVTLEPSPTPTLTPYVARPTATPLSLRSIGGKLTAAGASGQVFFSLSQRGATGFVKQGIFVLDLKRFELLQVVESGYELQSVTEDGQLLLANRGDELALIKMDGSQPLILTNQFFVSGKMGAYFTKSEKKRIIFIEKNAQGSAIWSAALDGSDRKMLIDQQFSPLALFMPGGEGMLFWQKGDCASPDTCTLQGIWMSPMDAVQPQEIVDAYQPVFSADGKMFADAKEEGGKSVLINATLDRKIDKKIELPGDHLVDYAWSNDGKKLVALRLMRSDYFGRAAAVRVFIKLPQSPSFREYEPSSGLNARVIWSPNGQNLLLTGTDQLPSKAYRLVWRLLKPDNQKVVKLDEAVDLVRPDFITISNIYWIEKGN